MMQEKEISEKESLMIIHQMIQTAKKEQKVDGKSWIVWGWMLFLASLFTFLNLQYHWVSTFFFWNIFGVMTLILGLVETGRFFQGRKFKVKTYTQELFKKLNTGFFITLMLIIVSINVGVSPEKGFGLLLGLYGFWILIYGTVVSFRPSIIGAYITWGFAFASLFVDSFEITMIFHASAVMCGYIIPGHIANREFNKTHSDPKKKSV